PGTARWAGPSVAWPVTPSPLAPPAPRRPVGARRGAAFPWGVSSRHTAAGGPDRPRPHRNRDATPARRTPGSVWRGRRAAWFQSIRAVPRADRAPARRAEPRHRAVPAVQPADVSAWPAGWRGARPGGQARRPAGAG